MTNSAFDDLIKSYDDTAGKHFVTGRSRPAVDRFHFQSVSSRFRMTFRWTMRRLHRWGISRRKLRGGFLHTKLGDRILERDLWFPSRESLARAWLIGMVVTCIPFLPLQTLIACGFGFYFRANLPVCFILQYLSNPATAIFQLSACYFVGRLLFGDSPSTLWQHMERVVGSLVNAPSWSEAFGLLNWREFAALFLGSIVLGLALGLLGYLGTHLVWKDKPRKPRKLHLLGMPRSHDPMAASRQDTDKQDQA